MCISQNQFSLASEAFGLHSAFCRTVAHWGKRIFNGATMKTHGKTKTPEFNAWSNMRKRCKLKMFYKNYGSRGIVVCKRWEKSFENFLLDMGAKPTPKHTLDRINNDGNYEPSNCRWATPKEQQRNNRGNRIVVFNGEKVPLTVVSETTKLSYARLWYRIVKCKWSVEKAISFPAYPNGRPPKIKPHYTQLEIQQAIAG